MRPRKRLVLLGTATLGLAALGSASASDSIRPGEYEITSEIHMEGAKPEMPPTRFRHCFKESDLREYRHIAESTRKYGDCEMKNLEESAGRVTWSMECKSGARWESVLVYDDNGYEQTSTREQAAGSRSRKTTIRTVARRVGNCGEEAPRKENK